MNDNLDLLEKNNIRSIDLHSGDSVNAYLRGDIRRAELRKELIRRRQEMTQTIRGIDKILGIIPRCPRKV